MKLLFFIIAIACISCSNKDYSNISTFSDKGNLHAVIEIAAGTNRKIEYDKVQKKFLCNKVGNKDRIINFLPYPANYGFIPSTLMDKEHGGDGDPLDVIVIAESIPTATVIEIIPLATIKMIENNEIDYKIVAIPVEDHLKIVHCRTYNELTEKHFAIIEILNLWFKNYKGSDNIEIDSWLNEAETEAEIKKWCISK
jgi:inorganic pyrophosphatase